MAEDILHKAQENAHNINAMNRIMNYSTNEYFTPTDEVGQYSWNNANKGIQAVAQHLADNPDISDADIETILRGNDSYYDVATNYGGHKMADAKWRDAFTVGARGDVIRAARNAANNYNIFQSDAAAQAEQAARAEIDARNAANRAAVEARNQAPLIYSRGGNEYEIKRDFSDGLKERMQELSVANDAEAAGIYAGLKEQLAAMGVKFADGNATGITGANAMQSLINSGATLQDKIAIRDILSMAANRQDEVFEEEKYQAPQDTRSFADRLIERQEREAKLERDREQQRIERARAREGFAGLAATIGDMIRASEGAPVLQRDWQRFYDGLTAQEKANNNNYRIRMQKLREDALAERARQQALAAAQAKDFSDKQFQLNLELQKERAALGKQAAQQQWKERENQLDRDAAETRARIYAEGKEQQYQSRLNDESRSFMIDGNVYYFPKGQIKDIANQLATTIKAEYKKDIKFFQDIDGFKNDDEVIRSLQNLLSDKKELDKYPGMREQIVNFLSNQSIQQQYNVMKSFDSSYTPANYQAAQATTGGYRPQKKSMTNSEEE